MKATLRHEKLNDEILSLAQRMKATAAHAELLQRIKIYLNRGKRYSVLSGGVPLNLEVYEPVSAVASTTIVLVHGMGGCGRMYISSIALLADAGIRVITIDLRGHGLSGGRDGDFSVSEIIADLQLVLRWVRERYTGKVGLLGSSLGSYFAYFTAARGAKVDFLICHNIFLPRHYPGPADHLKSRLIKILCLFVPQMRLPISFLADTTKVANSPELLAWFERQESPLYIWKYTLRAFHSLAFEDLRPTDLALDMPLAVIIGEADVMIPRDYTEMIYSKVQPRCKKMFVVPKAGHLLLMEAPEQTLELLLPWIKEVFHEKGRRFDRKSFSPS